MDNDDYRALMILVQGELLERQQELQTYGQFQCDPWSPLRQELTKEYERRVNPPSSEQP